MNEHQKLILNKCAEFAGFTVAQHYSESSNVQGEFFFIMGDNALRGTTYPNNPIEIEMGSDHFWIKWVPWNPLADQRDVQHLIDVFTDKGYMVVFSYTHISVHGWVYADGLGDQKLARSVGEDVNNVICSMVCEYSRKNN